MRIEERVCLTAEPEAVWAHVADPANWPLLMDGLAACEPEDDEPPGAGSRYRMRLRVNSAQVGGLVELVEYDGARDIAWTGVTGIDQRGRWRLRRTSDGRTTVTLRLVYQSPAGILGGILGVMADRLAAPTVRGHLRTGLAELRRRVEGGTPVQPARQTLGSRIDAVRVLADAGLVRPMRPTHLVQSIMAIARWGLTPAAGYAAAAARHGDEAAVIDDAGEETFAQLDARSTSIAVGLRGLGVKPGHRVGILCRNHRHVIEALVALSKLGADAVMLNTGFAGPQTVEVARRDGIRLIICDAEFQAPLRDAGYRGRRVVAWHEGRSRATTLDALAATEPGRLDPPERQGRVVVLTSGTTGTPKGASRGAPSSIQPAVSILSRIPLEARQRTLVASPLFHAWGLAHVTLGLLLSTTLVLERHFDAEAVLSSIERRQVEVLVCVPVMLQRLLEARERAGVTYDTSSLRVVAVSGSSLSGALATRFMDSFGDILYNLYGSTEVAWATIATPAELRAAPGTAGRPPAGTVLAIVDENDNPLPQGRTGRIFVGNDMGFEGYLGGGDKHRIGALVSTGDMGHIDAMGLLTVEGREDDMIVSGGENVHPQEVEELLATHGDVADVAVIGVPDDRFGQRLVAFVVARAGAAPDPDALRDLVRSRLARYKVPRDIVVVDVLPRNATGKVLRRELAATTTRRAARGRRRG